MPNERTTTNVVHRLSPEVMAHLERMATQPCKTVPTTKIEAGFNLGVQHVIKLLRDGFTISA